jgi:hypothetical protein
MIGSDTLSSLTKVSLKDVGLVTWLFLCLQAAVVMAVPVNSCVTNCMTGCSSATVRTDLCCTRMDTAVSVSD